MFKRYFILVIVLLIFNLSFAQIQDKLEQALVILNPANLNEMKTIIYFIEKEGGRVVHRYPPHILIGYFPAEVKSELLKKANIEIITSVIDPSQYSGLGKTAVYTLEAWNNNFQGLSKNKGLDKPPSPNAEPLVGDEVFEEDNEKEGPALWESLMVPDSGI